ncbi:Histone acetyltransferase protein [Dioscorea alata]|nr:Histone acetyltransferase protein [Dioscorea alata]
MMTRLQRKKLDMTHAEGCSGSKNDIIQKKDHEDFKPGSLPEHEKVKNIAKIELGRFEMETWYFSPFPPEYNECEKLYFCEFCLNYMEKKEQLLRHMKKCQLKHPPGNEIYRSGTLSMFEVDGMKNKMYSQNLCSISKLFIEHKTADIEVGGFLFYVLCECDDRGCHIVAYFSKHTNSQRSRAKQGPRSGHFLI